MKTPRFSHASSFAVAVATLLAAQMAWADIKWIGGATGTWSTGSSWDGGVPSDTDNIYFNSVSTVTLSLDDLFGIQNIDFLGTYASVTIAGMTLTLNGLISNTGNLGHNFTNTVKLSGGNHEINTGSGSLLFIAGNALTGAGSIEKTGTGTMYLAATDYSGETLLTEGTLELDSKYSLAGSTLNTGASGTRSVVFKAAGNSAGLYTIGGLAGSLDLTVSSLTTVSGSSGNRDLSVGANGSTTTYSGILSGDCDFAKVGTGTLTFSGANAYTGITTLTGGKLSVGTIGDGGVAGNLGQASNTATNLVFNGGTLQYTGGTASTDRSFVINTGKTATIEVYTSTSNLTISGASTSTTGALTKSGAGTLILSGTNLYTGVTTLTAGKLSVDTIGDGGVAGNLGQASNTATNLVFNGGTLQYTGGTASTDRSFVINTGKTATIEVYTSTSNLTISGASTSTTGALTKSGAGTLILSGSNQATGQTTISAGTLQLGNGSTTGSLSSSSALVNNATLTFNRSNALAQGSDFNSSISGTGNVIQAGGGTTTLSGTNSYTGTTKVNAGVLNVTGSLASGSVVTVGGDGSSGTPTLAGNGTVNGATTIAAQGTGVVGIHAPTLKQTFGSSLTYNTGSIFEWDLASSALGNRGTTYDAVNVGAISGSGAVFKVILDSGNFSEGFWDSNRTWADIFKTADGGAAVSIASTFASANIQWFTGSTNMTALTGGEGYFTTSGTNLNWTAVPEPTSALAGMLLGAGLLRRRRK